jgi:hypothetical protein
MVEDSFILHRARAEVELELARREPCPPGLAEPDVLFLVVLLLC